MYRLVASAFAVVLGAGTAHAADYSYDRGPASHGMHGSIWQGPYFGANVGWASGKMRGEAEIDLDPDPPAVLRGSLDARGVLGGVHAGYNSLSGPILFGVEADIQMAGISGSLGNSLAGMRGKLNWFSTLRGRLGFAHDYFLFYGTGGLAIGGGKATAYAGDLSASKSRTHVGWTLGAGVEMALNQEISVRLEYLYADFGRKNYLSGFGIDSKAGLIAHIVRFGATAHF